MKNRALLIGIAFSSPLIVPAIASLIFPKNWWAVGIGLVLGFILAIVATIMWFYETDRIDADEKRKTGEEVRQAVTSGSAMDIAVVNMEKLDEYYTLNKSQARNSFAASIGAVCIGFVAILIAARFANDTKQAIPAALGGILLNFIGGGFFVMYNKSIQQLNLFYGKLVRLQDTMLAVQQCEKLSSDDIDRVRERIILELIRRSSDAEVEVVKPLPRSKAEGPNRQAGTGIRRPGRMVRAAAAAQAGGAPVLTASDKDSE